VGRIAHVESSERYTEEGDDGTAHLTRVKCDPGGGALQVVEHFSDCGDDSLPLPGDPVALEDASGSGNEQVVGYADIKNAPKAGPGEKRIYSRAADGSPAAEFWLKANGDIVVTSLAPGGKITLNGVTIDQQSNLTAPGEVVAMAATPATAVKLSTHLHPTGVGPTSPPTPGT
jgi:hypothetical protein